VVGEAAQAAVGSIYDREADEEYKLVLKRTSKHGHTAFRAVVMAPEGNDTMPSLYEARDKLLDLQEYLEAYLGTERYEVRLASASVAKALRGPAKPANPADHPRAPKGGAMVAGQSFKGGEFIPKEVWAKASDAERKQVLGGPPKAAQKPAADVETVTAGGQVWPIDKVVEVPLELIQPNLEQDRSRGSFDVESLRGLADSIVAQGLQQPILLRPVDGGLQIVAGERRFRAHEVAGLPTARAIIRNMSDRQAWDAMLVENLARKDLNPIEEARAFVRRLELGQTPEELAQVSGQSVRNVTRKLGLLQLLPSLQKLVEDGHLDVSRAEVMGQLDHDRQIIAMKYLDTTRTLADFRDAVQPLLAEQAMGGLFGALDEAAATEERVKGVRRSTEGQRVRRLSERILNGIGRTAGQIERETHLSLLPLVAQEQLGELVDKLELTERAIERLKLPLKAAQQYKTKYGSNWPAHYLADVEAGKMGQKMQRTARQSSGGFDKAQGDYVKAMQRRQRAESDLRALQSRKTASKTVLSAARQEVKNATLAFDGAQKRLESAVSRADALHKALVTLSLSLGVFQTHPE
jgi:ParB family chromosome partitioning protein